MSKIFTVGWDHDGVLTKSHIPVLLHANASLPGLDLRYSKLNSWDALYDRVLQLTNDPVQAEQINHAWFDPIILCQSPPYHLNLSIVQWCQAIGINNHIITTRNPDLAKSTTSWYRQHLPLIVNENRLHIRSDLTLTGNQFKHSQITGLEANLFVEDSAETVDFLLSRGFSHLIFLTRPWNASRTDLDYLRCPSSLVLFTRIIHQYLHYRLAH